jgi:hypothetical protein
MQQNRYQEEISIGELYRLCLKIDAAVQAQNGRVQALEKDAIRIKAFWTAGVILASLFGGYIKSKLGL